MPEWLNSVSSGIEADVPTLAMRLGIAWLAGWAVALIARNNRRSEAIDTLSLTLVLMSILIAMATQIIGDNVARAFSLVGALSIVRFRTAVPETRDVAFVLAAVVVGMAVGAGQYWVCGIGICIVALASQFYVPATIKNITPQPRESWRLTLKVGLHSIGGWEAELTQLTESYQLLSAETSRRGGALELIYRYQPRDDIDASTLIAALNAVPNVESASAKTIG